MPPTTAATNLNLLPPELLLLISQHLSPVDSTCLALCSRRLFTLPFRDLMYSPCPQGGPGGLAADDDLRVDLLTRLSRGLPEYYLCYACLRLHFWRHVNLPAPNFKLRKCYDNLPWDKEKSLSLSLFNSLEFPAYSTCGFHWVHLYLAMRRFYLGPSFGFPLESLLYTEVATQCLHSGLYSQEQTSEIKSRLHPGRRTGLRSVEARICPTPASLCLRIQDLAMTHRQSASLLFPRQSRIQICRHIRAPASKFTESHKFSEIIDSVFKVYRQQGQSVAGLSSHGKCHHCDTAWSLELRDVEANEVCLVLPRWKDLGPGLTPEDLRWRIQLPWGPFVSLENADILNDPRARFEIEAKNPQGHWSQNLSVDDMLVRNLALLRGRRYRHIMKQQGPGRWYLQGDEDEAKRSRLECVVL